jgi:hypothetical protein
VERLKQREGEKADLLTSLRQLEGKREIARVEVTPDALMLALSVWRGQLEEKAKSDNILETKRMLSRFVEKVELGYKKANLWYTYPVDNNVPFRVYSGGGT